MDKVLSKSDLSKEIQKVACQPGSILFAGAGVGKRAGLPNWQEYIEHLASVGETYEKESAALIRKRLSEGLLTHAIEIYKSCPFIPEGKKYEELASPFLSSCYKAQTLQALVALPFNAIVTTNFDRSLHDAYALVNGVSPISASLGDSSLKQAIYNWKDFYIARIHGCAEIPNTMVLDRSDYRKTEEDLDYTEFLIHIFTHKQCLFVGYSFMDPAIQRILMVLNERIGPNFPELHLALLPQSAIDFALILAKYNIKVLRYDEHDNHSSLWDSVRAALSLYRNGLPKPGPVYPRPLEAAHRLLAISYTRMVFSKEIEPLQRIVLEGVLLALLQELDNATEKELSEVLRKYIPLTRREASELVATGMESLEKKDWIRRSGEHFELHCSIKDTLSEELKILADGVKQRLIVSYGTKVSVNEESIITKVFEDLILARGWDLGASLASAKRTDAFEITPVMEATIKEVGKLLRPDLSRIIASATLDLIKRPNRRESDILARLGRLAFGVEVVLERGRSILVRSLTLPERLYLDANVLMPAITEGHPYRKAYALAIERLQKAAERSGSNTKALVLDVFLNEIVAHRANAIAFIKEGGLGHPERLTKSISLSGADFTNVFVGGYASFVGREKKGISFEEYLEKVAPYVTEEELQKFLIDRGIETVSSRLDNEEKNKYYSEFYNELNRAYDEDAVYLMDKKPTVLISHEARQLVRLQSDLEAGIRTLFVTADSRLRRLAVGKILGRVSSALFSHIGLLQLVDLMIGLEETPESITRLLWAVEARDEEEVLRGYFIDQALRQYDAALAMVAPKIVDEIVQKAKERIKEEGVRLSCHLSGEDVNKTFRFLDRYEEKFFENMAEEIERQQKDK